MERREREKMLLATGSIYKLCNLAAMRALELNSGMKKLVDADPSEKITTIAIREISEGKVTLKKEGSASTKKEVKKAAKKTVKKTVKV